MKTLIALLCLLISSTSGARIAIVPLDPMATSLLPIRGEAQVAVQSTKECTPQQCSIFSKVVVEYTLMGCLDQFAGFEKVVKQEDGSFDIYITALNIVDARSSKVACFALPMAHQSIFLGSGVITEEEVRVHFIGVNDDSFVQDSI